jgi:hypothetical protein
MSAPLCMRCRRELSAVTTEYMTREDALAVLCEMLPNTHPRLLDLNYRQSPPWLLDSWSHECVSVRSPMPEGRGSRGRHTPPLRGAHV